VPGAGIVVKATSIGVEIMAPPGMEEMTNQLQGLFQNMGNSKTKTRKLPIKDALKYLIDEEAAKLAVETAAETVRDLMVAEVIKLDLTLEDGKVKNYRARINISFKYQKEA